MWKLGDDNHQHSKDVANLGESLGNVRIVQRHSSSLDRSTDIEFLVRNTLDNDSIYQPVSDQTLSSNDKSRTGEVI